ncbi:MULTISPECIES: Lrp/AsnC family transcriptional regulator [unclassified Achromobacter]|uniref:Lrp/AsnC family transcriptional regulator n=1 Tax=unclassified Achromobacter TaxID=2626865 RepID=UPI000B51A8AC|nr:MULTISPECIES: Lrp/AsnC family transcriptional regulator [unclassified Achromobacter]OWT73500.1 transcriptional regulator [Achromobacter sp. HZ34]OWT79581.1 transcriptional regulator [Achromobacter sp. HZ28]
MDAIDRKIISILQENAETPIQAIADVVNLSTTPCWRRVQKLKEQGVIKKQVALCDPAMLNVGVTVFISIRTNQHSQTWLNKFANHVKDIPEVIEFYRMSGDVDYLIRVVVPDIGTYDAVYKKLIRIADLHDVSSSFAMEQIKYTTALPVDYCD